MSSDFIITVTTRHTKEQLLTEYGLLMMTCILKSVCNSEVISSEQ